VNFPAEFFNFNGWCVGGAMGLCTKTVAASRDKTDDNHNVNTKADIIFV